MAWIMSVLRAPHICVQNAGSWVRTAENFSELLTSPLKWCSLAAKGVSSSVCNNTTLVCVCLLRGN